MSQCLLFGDAKRCEFLDLMVESASFQASAKKIERFRFKFVCLQPDLESCELLAILCQ